jgi:hypothetical protein
MSEFTSEQKRILKQHSRAIVHMRHRHERRKFSLVLGAGISHDFGIPKWDELLERISRDRKVNGDSLLARNKDRSHGPKTQILFHRFASRLQAKNEQLSYAEIKNRWRQIIRKRLYEEGKKNIEDLVASHPYIAPFVKLVQESPMTVNYNFDDYIEKILHNAGFGGTAPEHARSFETVWDPQLQTKLDKSVIYHPNGFLPESKIERQSEGLVFCEDEFADQLIETMAGRYASLLHHYSQNTCLFIGLSLEDSTLKHLMRQSATLNPGHYHYYVDYYNDSGDKPPPREQHAIYETNFSLYNMITLFMTGQELKELGCLVGLPNDEFLQSAATASINLVFCYYVIGAIGAGKSSVISFFRNLTTHDEWPDFRRPELGKRYKTLTSQQEQKIDNWINRQFKKKNDILSRATSGLHIIDRAPLDPIAFKKKPKRRARANSLMASLCASGGAGKIQRGRVILLVGEPEILEQRAQAGGKGEYAAGDLDDMQKTLMRLYDFRKGVSLVDTHHKSKGEIVKEIAEIVHTEEYEAADLHLRLSNVARGRYKC